MLRVVSYNILAPSYAKPGYYPFTDRALLRWDVRRERLVQRLLDLNGDVLCLQEVESQVYSALRSAIEPAGYRGLYSQKGCNRPDGCATFYRTGRMSLTDNNTVLFSDGDGAIDSGHIALIARFAVDDRLVSVVNTHIRWDEPGRQGPAHVGYRQVVELLALCKPAACGEAWIACGDFNAQPGSDIIRQILAAGFIDAYAAAPQPTSNADCEAKRIDYLFHSPALASIPDALPQIDGRTPLPSEIHPSDHLPISAEIRFAASGAQRP